MRFGLSRVVMDVCLSCLSFEVGGECHTPGCAFWMDDAPDVATVTVLRHHVTTPRAEAPNQGEGTP